MSVRRGTSNGNAQGSADDRHRRRVYLVTTYRADQDARHVYGTFPTDPVVTLGVPLGEGIPACRCYRCGALLTVETVTVDRIIPGCRGGTYQRSNVRPACGPCNSETGGSTRSRD